MNNSKCHFQNQQFAKYAIQFNLVAQITNLAENSLRENYMIESYYCIERVVAVVAKWVIINIIVIVTNRSFKPIH